MTPSLPPQARRRYRHAAIAWTLVILALCLWPHPHLAHAPRIPHLDKIVHALIFIVEGFLLRAAGIRTRVCAALGLALAASTEILQASIPALGRTGELGDAIADALGLVVGAVAFRVLSRRALARRRD